MTNQLTSHEIEELRKDKQAITAQSDTLWEIFLQQQQDEPDIESIYEALQ